MKIFTDQLNELKQAAQAIVLSHFKDGEVQFSSRTVTFDNGGWSQRESIDEELLYKLSAEFVCDLADELTCGF